MNLAVMELLERNERLDAEAIDRFLAAHGSPIVQGRTITFLWRGNAHAVRLRRFLRGVPASQDLRRITGTDLWHLTIEVPRGSRVEYKFEVDEAGATRLVLDPLNPRIAHDPYGANSVSYGPGYQTPDWTQHDPLAPPGGIEEIRIASTALSGERSVCVYVPFRARVRRAARRHPLLVCFDGTDYLHFAHVATVLDNLIHRREIAPLIVAFSQSPDRLHEYAANAAHSRFVADELLPELERRFPVRRRPRDRGLMGASLGAVAALHTAWSHPGCFDKLLLQSGSFAFTDLGGGRRRGLFEPVVDFVDQVRAEPRRPASRVFMSCGTYEALLHENRALVPVLRQRGVDVRYVEAHDGHNWGNWRDRLREGLSWLFPGRVALVYE